ncbi:MULTISPECIES: Hsp20/alpha crystallin family protein [unclassified Dysgonomonas]|uniref:Hsp20/alpha crystallin family protein n=1 Tax=unclassified Dysgonomonas TaxID=2630389 RepID=UPI0013EC28C0|nr:MULTISPECIES: Hsp20/alpha crystallin family protein [unclassified Dysgonomonas]
MNIIRRNPNWLPDVFNDLFNNDWMPRTNATAPAINISESKDDYKIEVAAPGMTKDDFCIRFDEENNLVISMEKKVEHTEDNKESRYLRREFSYSKFEQRMVLPNNVEKDKIHAKMENGVLGISIPKIKEDKIKDSMKLIEIE